MDSYMIRGYIGNHQVWLQMGRTDLGETASLTTRQASGDIFNRNEIEHLWQMPVVKNLLVELDYEILPIGSSPQIRLN